MKLLAFALLMSSAVAAAQPARSSRPRFGPRSPAPTLSPRTPASPAATCTSSVLREARHCMALVGHGGKPRIHAIGLDSGTSCTGPEVDADLGGAASLGWMGDRLYACSNHKVVEIRLVDGAVRTTSIACDAVTSLGKELLVGPEAASRPHLERYASFDDLLAKRSTGRVLLPSRSTTIAVRNDIGYAGGEDELAALAWRPYAHATSVPLERPATPMHALDVLRDGTVVVAGASEGSGRGSTIRFHDGTTGALRSGHVVVADHVAALKCR